MLRMLACSDARAARSSPGCRCRRNRGIAEAKTPWIAFLDDDEQAEPRWLLELADAAGETGALCLGGPAIPLLPPSCPAELAPALHQLVTQREAYPTLCRCPGNKVLGTGNIVIHRDVFQRIGVFDETLREAGEDTDLCWRMRMAGIELWHVPRARILHSIEPSRVEEPYLRWNAQRAGFCFARRDLNRYGVLGVLGLAAARLALLLGVRLPLYLWAMLRRDAGRTLILRHRFWLNEAYFRGASHLLAPAFFAQRAFVAGLDFRSERGASKENVAAPGDRGPCNLSDGAADGVGKERLMKITVAQAGQVPMNVWESWSELQQADPRYDSPYFRPEFTRAVAAVRQDVEVAVLWQGDERVGFFPFQRHPRNVGVPVGEAMSDFHGVIAREGVPWEAEELIRACRLAAWKFDHLPTWQEAFRPYHLRSMISPYIDLRGNFAADDPAPGENTGSSECRDPAPGENTGSSGCRVPAAGRVRKGPRGFHDVIKKWREFCREVGPLRFEPDVRDEECFDTLIRWKRAQYERTQMPDALAASWKIDLLARIRDATRHPAEDIACSGCRVPGDTFGGLLSALYAGDRPVAIHLGMNSQTVMHAWFPAYDLSLARYSPGLLLFCELCKTAAARGYQRLDLGKGEQRFKTSLMSGAFQVAEGATDFRFLVRTARRSWYSLCAWIRGTRLRGPARAGMAMVRPVQRWLGLRSDRPGGVLAQRVGAGGWRCGRRRRSSRIANVRSRCE